MFNYGIPLRPASLSLDYRAERLGVRAVTSCPAALSQQFWRQLFQEVFLVPIDHLG
jgi:hypothetical protein